MGFMDKAKKMAEQAQTKLDEVQKQFNEGQQQGHGAGDPAVAYDKHGRPADTAPATAPPPAEQAPSPVPDPVEGVAPAAPPFAPTEAAAPEREDYTPPKV